MKKALLTLFFQSFGFLLFAQDIQYSQYYANPIYLNPAFTGSTGLTRVGVNFRNQWPALEQSFIAYTAYFDHFEEKINSGFGLIIQGAQESFSQTSLNEVGLVYSYRLKLTEKSYLQAGFQGSFVARDALFDQVILGTQLDINTGSIIGEPGDAFEGDSQIRSVDSNAGLLYYGSKAWFGVSVSHLLEPEISYLADNTNQLPMKYSLHGGYRFDLAPGDINEYFNNTNQERSITLGFNYKEQGQFSQLDLGAEFYFEPLVLGFWYRGLPTKYSLPNNEALIFLLGVNLSSGIELGYSFDYSISKLGFLSSGGAHELSFRYVFSSKDPRKRYYAPLPSFRY
ncbi:MAG: type IX secretion system membrane protein PorP/SprF [Algoriphagus sp.]|uniref:PorP/SprF family type IX secretion system membrane protein n=1 Tax=Algoriphagus sp. TaxID=1872435 RepID=UPI00271E2AE5|nr:type IX secretion system membrane protein PorP/SprF [Algoriphagus sp.]MDO8968862.1 type IX secretion system membrane protein PorP/SprF [Algoriphagus sp.]MDP2040982.1 type IX secretion system membrane protein PorP/SprF [Algoriphagus sp.]MDP3200460.1 type IX secretion system membrane protein PorP/SprF [Algoriphagus sp.]MDP3470534.1 type IX secretion system membrane protein PorP/SprF [Algoriphagus sp.]